MNTEEGEKLNTALKWDPDPKLKLLVFTKNDSYSQNINDTSGVCCKGSGINEEDTKNPGKCTTAFRGKYAGILLAILASLIFTLGALIVKLMKGYHPLTLAVYRLQGVFLPSVLLASYAKCSQKKEIFEPIWPLTPKSNLKNVFFLLIRAVTGCTGLVLSYYSLKYLSIADAMTIGCIKPVLVTFVAHVTLGEKGGLFSIFVAFLTVLGVGIILRPPILTGSDDFDQDLVIGAAYAFGAMIVTTCNAAMIRYLRKIHYSIVLLGFSTSGTLMTLSLSLSFGVFVLPQGYTDWSYAIAIAAIALICQTLIILSFKKEKAGTVTIVIKTTEILFAMFWQCIFLGMYPDIFSLIGATIVTLGVVLTAWSKWISTLPMDHPTKKKYYFILN